MDKVCTTIPDDQMRTYYNAIKMGSYTIGVKNPGAAARDDVNYGAWFPWNVLNALLEGCHDHCMMCDLDAQGQKACGLRKAMDSIPNEIADLPDGGCPYYTQL